LLTYTIEWFTARRFPHQQELRIPLKRAGKGKTVRAVVYLPPAGKHAPNTTSTATIAAATAEFGTTDATQTPKIPLHLNIHGGAFLGGLPEGNARFCAQLARESGAVVVSTGYRYTPVAMFPDAHEDVQDVAEWLLEHAEEMWGADPGCFTVSGFSVGGNLGLGVAQGLLGRGESGEVRGLVSFEGVVCSFLFFSLPRLLHGYALRFLYAELKANMHVDGLPYTPLAEASTNGLRRARPSPIPTASLRRLRRP
jgi:acetyl esterase/lipase